ncbi:hypothetical protein [Pseudobacillus badius]|nr:hypothetical protein [Bacillus badius]GLY11896.1 hypothetical protein Bbad01_31120 [Bacillus badius]
MTPVPSILALSIAQFIERFLCVIKDGGDPLNEPMAYFIKY